ncbi:MAG: hypothetical protein LBE65_02130 [Synergistaceae bacterium]|nr:hypothetical protein [Synergistaceae bacterium]
MGRNDNGVENHLKRVERWLGRCVAACRGGSWRDALSEAECLEAEAKGLREKLWRATEAEVAGADKIRGCSRVVAPLKVAALALVMVLTAVLPISTDIGPLSPETAYAPETFEFLTSDEGDIINALRKSLSGGNRGEAALTAETPKETAPAAKAKRGAAMASEAKEVKASSRAAETGEKIKMTAESPRRPSADEVITLIQVGQKALRVSEPGIKVEM